MNHYEKIHSGELYDPNDEDVLAEQRECLGKLYDFNATRPSQMRERTVTIEGNVC